MAEWWNSLGQIGQIFACMAIPATVILLAQTVLMLIGIGGDHDIDGDGVPDGTPIDIDGDGVIDGYDTTGDGLIDTVSHGDTDGVASGASLRLFTMRGIIAFFAVMGWTGAVCTSAELNIGISVAIALAAGIAAMVGVALIMKWMLSLQYDGTENIKEALGKSGNVYIRIPAERNGSGKVNIVIQSRIAEKEAVTDEKTDILYGEEITVIGISGDDTLIVRRKGGSK